SAEDGGGRPRARRKALRNPSAEGSTLRASIRTEGMPISVAISASAPSNVVLPTPPGPNTCRTWNGNVDALRAARNRVSSAPRPTNRCRRVAWNETLTAGGALQGGAVHADAEAGGVRQHEIAIFQAHRGEELVLPGMEAGVALHDHAVVDGGDGVGADIVVAVRRHGQVVGGGERGDAQPLREAAGG